MFRTISGREKGFTLVETMLAVLLTALLVSVVLKIYQYQVVSFKRAEITIEVQDNMRAVVNWVAGDLYEATGILQSGDGLGEAGALVLQKEGEGVVAYYCEGNPTVFYRSTAYPPGSDKQPLTNGGYLRGWSIRYYDEYDKELPPGNPGAVGRVDFTVRGGYGDLPDRFLSSSVYLRQNTVELSN